MFNIQVARDDLLLALQAVSSTVGDNSQGLGDNCISITDLGNNFIQVYTSNSVEFSSVEIVLTKGSTGKSERMPFIEFKRFKTIIESIPKGEYVNIKASTNDIEIDYKTFGNKGKPIKLTGATNGMIPLPTFTTPTDLLCIDTILIKNSIDKICSITKNDPNNQYSGCFKISTDQYNVDFISIDNKNNRMCLCSGTNTNVNKGDMFLEADKFKKAFKQLFMEYDDIYMETNGNINRIMGNTKISSSSTILYSPTYYTRVLNATFPPVIKSMFDNVNDFVEIDKDELTASLIRIGAIEDNVIGAGTMELKIHNNVIDIIKTSQYGIVEDSFDTNTESSVSFNEVFKAKPLAEILKNFQSTPDVAYSHSSFEIGVGTNSVNNTNYYVLKEGSCKGSIDTKFLIIGLGQQTPNNP